MPAHLPNGSRTLAQQKTTSHETLLFQERNSSNQGAKEKQDISPVKDEVEDVDEDGL